jgi:hypothetical protein
MPSEIQTIRTELKAIEEWVRKFKPGDALDEIGVECRRLRREELLRKLAELASRN